MLSSRSWKVGELVAPAGAANSYRKSTKFWIIFSPFLGTRMRTEPGGGVTAPVEGAVWAEMLPNVSRIAEKALTKRRNVRPPKFRSSVRLVTPFVGSGLPTLSP
jgi:hypothetical protein